MHASASHDNIKGHVVACMQVLAMTKHRGWRICEWAMAYFTLAHARVPAIGAVGFVCFVWSVGVRYVHEHAAHATSQRG